jgi:hypothetical protein
MNSLIIYIYEHLKPDIRRRIYFEVILFKYKGTLKMIYEQMRRESLIEIYDFIIKASSTRKFKIIFLEIGQDEQIFTVAFDDNKWMIKDEFETNHALTKQSLHILSATEDIIGLKFTEIIEKLNVTHYCNCNDGFVNIGWK